jgi:hydroxymethylpyrimidine pyrophosphatase-like HAD family hydrolase
MPANRKNRRPPSPWCNPASSVIRKTLAYFVAHSDFARTGAVITDLDGTALHENNGRICIAKPVELGLKRLYDLGRPFILNSLRSPDSVLRNFGRDWYSISNAPIPAITLNGSLLGYVTQMAAGEITFEEIAAFPLLPAEIDAALDEAAKLIADGVQDLLLFYYPRRWPAGENIWTPAAPKVPEVRQRHRNAKSITAWEPCRLRAHLHAEDICMILLQHTGRDHIRTRAGINKLSGAQQIAKLLDVDLGSSIGAGDTDMDCFLRGVGLAVLVGTFPLEFGDLLFQVGDLLLAPCS